MPRFATYEEWWALHEARAHGVLYSAEPTRFAFRARTPEERAAGGQAKHIDPAVIESLVIHGWAELARKQDHPGLYPAYWCVPTCAGRALVEPEAAYVQSEIEIEELEAMIAHEIRYDNEA